MPLYYQYMKTILVDAVHCYVIAGQGIFQPMHDLLESFPNPKIVVTGADDQQFIEFGLDAVTYPIFSLKHHPEKTDPAYFHSLLAKYGLEVENVLYFEHDPAAVKSAASLGITCFHYDPELKDLVALRAFLEQNS